MIELVNISKYFDGIEAVKRINASILPGRIYGFLGPNGAGKTTTLRMIVDILQPDEGDILFDGKSIRPKASDIGYLPEERGLYQKIGVRETLMYFAQLRGLSHPDIKIRDYLRRFELDDRMSAKVNELSKGNQQKLQFINTILHDPQYLILDEPFSGLDPVNQLVLKEILNEMRTAGKTIMFSSHQMDQVEKICDDVALINKGEMVLSGKLSEIKKRHGHKTLCVIPAREDELDHPVFQNIKAEIHDGAAYIPLLSEEDKRPLIHQITEAVDINSIQLAEPGLEEIFIDSVKGSHS